MKGNVFIHSIGPLSAGGLLPPYKIKITYLAMDDTITAGDLLLIGQNEYGLESWTSVSPASLFCGKTVAEVREFCNGRKLIFGRKDQEGD